MEKEVQWANPLIHQDKFRTPGVLPASELPAIQLMLHEGDEYCGLEIWDDLASAQDVKRLRARKFVELIMDGKTPTKAAQEIGAGLSRYQYREEVQAEIKKTIEMWHYPPEVRKMYSRAKLMEIAVTQDTSDPKAAKVALDAIRALGDDVETGMYGKQPAPTVRVEATLPEPLMKLLGGTAEEKDAVDGEDAA